MNSVGKNVTFVEGLIFGKDNYGLILTWVSQKDKKRLGTGTEVYLIDVNLTNSQLRSIIYSKATAWFIFYICNFISL